MPSCEQCKGYFPKEKLSKCARCRAVWYCCREHQKLDWKIHKRSCVPALKVPIVSETGDRTVSVAKEILKSATSAGRDGRPKQEIRMLKKLLKRDPYQATAWFNLAQAYNESESKGKALEAYARCLEVLTDSAPGETANGTVQCVNVAANSEEQDLVNAFKDDVILRARDHVDAFVRGKGPEELRSTALAQAARAMSCFADSTAVADGWRLRKDYASSAHHCAGNAYRKLDRIEEGVEELRRADQCLVDSGLGHDWASRTLIPEMLMRAAMLRSRTGQPKDTDAIGKQLADEAVEYAQQSATLCRPESGIEAIREVQTGWANALYNRTMFEETLEFTPDLVPPKMLKYLRLAHGIVIKAAGSDGAGQQLAMLGAGIVQRLEHVESLFQQYKLSLGPTPQPQLTPK